MSSKSILRQTNATDLSILENVFILFKCIGFSTYPVYLSIIDWILEHFPRRSFCIHRWAGYIAWLSSSKGNVMKILLSAQQHVQLTHFKISSEVHGLMLKVSSSIFIWNRVMKDNSLLESDLYIMLLRI